MQPELWPSMKISFTANLLSLSHHIYLMIGCMCPFILDPGARGLRMLHTDWLDLKEVLKAKQTIHNAIHILMQYSEGAGHVRGHVPLYNFNCQHDYKVQLDWLKKKRDSVMK